MENLKKLESKKNKYETQLRTIQAEMDSYKYKNNIVNKEITDAKNALENIPSLIKAQVPENRFYLDVFTLSSLSLIKKSLINPKVKPMINR